MTRLLAWSLMLVPAAIFGCLGLGLGAFVLFAMGVTGGVLYGAMQ